MTSSVRSAPCSACPYRKDVPSGVWGAHEYDKLREYDAPTPEQPMSVFACHATPDHLCHGWAVCHNNRGHDHELIALRIAGTWDIPEPAVPLFGSGNEAADHGQRDIGNPTLEALAVMDTLERKYERLRKP